jgi:hypothetical protein
VASPALSPPARDTLAALLSHPEVEAVHLQRAPTLELGVQLRGRFTWWKDAPGAELRLLQVALADVRAGRAP